MVSDPVLAKLKKNLPDEVLVETVFRDSKMGVYFIYVEIIDKVTCCFIHLHDIVGDNGTTFFFGDDPNFAMGMGALSRQELYSAVGSDIYEKIMNIMAA